MRYQASQIDDPTEICNEQAMRFDYQKVYCICAICHKKEKRYGIDNDAFLKPLMVLLCTECRILLITASKDQKQIGYCQKTGM